MTSQVHRYSFHLKSPAPIIGLILAGIISSVSGTAVHPRVWPPSDVAAAANEVVSGTEQVACSSFAGFEVLDAKAQCGFLMVPENRQNPQSRTIKVAYAIVKAASPNPQPDPIVFLQGGPGARAIGSSWIKWPNASLAERDLILVDPRGVGYSQPTMKCPWKTPPGTSIQDHPPSADETRAFALQWARTCHDSLVSAGFDLAGYNSDNNADDLEDLRMALGYAPWNLYAVSYGTRTALETMRAFPQGIRSVVLDSVLPPQIDWTKTDLTSRVSALSALFDACGGDSACNRDYPDLEVKFMELVQRAGQNPIEVSIRDPESQQMQPIWITSSTIFFAVSEMLKRPWFIRIAPITIAQVSAGNTVVLERLAPSLIPDLNQAVYYSLTCQDGGTWFSRDEYQAALEKYPILLPFVTEFEDQAICKLWGGEQAPPKVRPPVTSDIPALVLTGSFLDSATPPTFAKLAATTLSRSFLYEFPAYSHAVSYNECPKGMLTAFIDNPTSAPDSSCMALIKARPFITDVYLNPGVFTLYTAVQLFDIRQSIALGLVALLFLSAIVALPAAYYRSQRQGHANRSLSNAARFSLWLVALLNIAFGVGAWQLVKQALTENSGWVTLFGFSPSSTGYLLILPWLTGILTIALLVFTYLAWKEGWWGRFARMYYTLGTLAAVGLSAFLLYSRVLSF